MDKFIQFYLWSTAACLLIGAYELVWKLVEDARRPTTQAYASLTWSGAAAFLFLLLLPVLNLLPAMWWASIRFGNRIEWLKRLMDQPIMKGRSGEDR